MTTDQPSRSKANHVIIAVGVVLVLAVLLGARIHGRSPAADPPVAAHIPQPESLQPGNLQVPCWACRESGEWPIKFRTDLDLLAPIGTGGENAADWWAGFTKEIGPRIDEWDAALERRVEHPLYKKVLPADDPLLLEAEPWCDQALMRFYPDVFELEGYETRIPNLVLAVTLGRSWVARGRAAEDPDAAMEDFRRSIRLGRLLRQDDVTIIADLVGLACIRWGLEGIFDRAIADGDTELALIASVILGEAAPQKLLTSERLTSVDLSPHIRDEPSGLSIELDTEMLDKVVDRATSDMDRRFRGEAIVSLNLVGYLATDPDHRDRAFEVLDQLCESEDLVVATAARHARDIAPDPEVLRSFL
jgi:hypothetical protein